MYLSFAPMEGVTSADFRRVHRAFFPEADCYYAPFIAPDAEGNFKKSHLRALLPDSNRGLTLVPQILTNSAQGFLGAARTLAEIGYTEVNLNAGCPSGTVVAKHKGAGMLADLGSLDAFLDEVFRSTPVAVSVKTRLGLHGASEFPAILEIYNRYPIKELIVHARDREGMYRSIPDRKAFAEAMAECRCPICYNGDVFIAEDARALCRELPGLTRIMLGRGAVCDPALFREIRGGGELQREELQAFHDALLEETLAGGLPTVFALARMKELWSYLILHFPDAGRSYKALNKAKDLPAFRAAADAIMTGGHFEPRARLDAWGRTGQT